MTKYEYKFLSIPDDKLDTETARLGRQGWSLDFVLGSEDVGRNRYIFSKATETFPVMVHIVDMLQQACVFASAWFIAAMIVAGSQAVIRAAFK